MKKPLSVTFNNNTTPRPAATLQAVVFTRLAQVANTENEISPTTANTTLYAQADDPDFVNQVDIGFTNNAHEQNFIPGDYLELDFSELCCNTGGKTEGVDVAGIALAGPSNDWEIEVSRPDSKIKLHAGKNFSWKEGDTFSITLNIPVNPITDPLKKIGNFSISDASYFGARPANELVVTMASFGADDRPLPLRAYFVDPSVEMPDIPEKRADLVFFTPDGLDLISNKLSFELDYSTLPAEAAPNNLGTAELLLSIQAGNDVWDLAPPNSAEGMALNIAHDVDYGTNPQWSISPVENENFIQFKCVPEIDTPLLPMDGGKKIRLELTNIVTALSAGTVNMTLQINGMAGFADWCWFLTIQKEAPMPRILSFNIVGAISIDQEATLQWQTFAMKDLQLSYEKPNGDVVSWKKSSKDIKLNDGSFQKILVTKAEVPVNCSSIFNVVLTLSDPDQVAEAKQIMLQMNPPAPEPEIWIASIIDMTNLTISYNTLYTNEIGILTSVGFESLPFENGTLQQRNIDSYRAILAINNNNLCYSWPTLNNEPGDVAIPFVAKNAVGSTKKELWFNQIKSTGPLGWDGATPFSAVNINSISILVGSVINAIIINGETYGGSEGDNKGEISMAPGEYISKIVVNTGAYQKKWSTGLFNQNDHEDDYNLVTYLEIHTNLGNTIQGGRTDAHDSSTTLEGRIFQLGGNTRGEFLEALDVYYLPENQFKNV